MECTEQIGLYAPKYRIAETSEGFEPQMQYLVCGKDRWYALLATGYIADPDIWSHGTDGESFVRVCLPSYEMAERAILRAKIINGQVSLLQCRCPPLPNDED